MNDTTKQDLYANLAALPRMASAWVMWAAAALGAVWFALPADQQQTLLAHSPLPAWAYPIVLSALGIVARVWPQKGFTAGIAPPDPAAPAASDTTSGATP